MSLQPLRQLGRRIVRKDHRALDELHGRKLFQHGGKRYRLVEFLQALAEGGLPHRLGAMQDMAYWAADLSLDKFLFYGNGDASSGIDCRGRFRAWLRALDAWRKENPNAGLLEQETQAARLLQGLVVSHFVLSVREARRSCRNGRSRYAWVLPTGTLLLLMPVHLGGAERRHWLEDSVPDADPERPGERRRVQAIIDERLPDPHPIPLERLGGGAVAAANGDPLHRLVRDHLDAYGLANTVADEKVAGFDRLPPSVRTIGRKTLRELIIEIFQDVASEDYCEAALAQRFGMSKAAVCRFAGQSAKPDGGLRLLWSNTAKVLAADERLVEAARGAGVWPAVEAAAGLKWKGSGQDHDPIRREED